MLATGNGEIKIIKENKYGQKEGNLEQIIEMGKDLGSTIVGVGGQSK